MDKGDLDRINHFAHGYATMEKNDIWETATKDIPNLQNFAKAL